jgi:putative oxidoreductase
LISARKSKGVNIFTWVLQILMGALFLFAGAFKLFGAFDMVRFFAEAGFGQWLRYALGALEVCSSVAFFLPKMAFAGSIVLSLSLAGHIFIHAVVLHRPAGFLFLLIAVTVSIAFLRRPPSPVNRPTFGR